MTAATLDAPADLMTDREALIAGMDRRGMNAAQVAKASGVGVATVYGFVAGELDPRVSTVDKLLDAVGVAKTHRLPKPSGRTARGPGRPPHER